MMLKCGDKNRKNYTFGVSDKNIKKSESNKNEKATTFCSACGMKLSANANFCSKCGSPI